MPHVNNRLITSGIEADSGQGYARLLARLPWTNQADGNHEQRGDE
jgi:hypothetical protein